MTHWLIGKFRLRVYNVPISLNRVCEVASEGVREELDYRTREVSDTRPKNGLILTVAECIFIEHDM